MEFQEFAAEVSRLWWGSQPPASVPRHILALYVTAHHVGMAPDVFMKFMQARNFVSTTTAGLISDDLSLDKGSALTALLATEIHPKDALFKLFSADEIRPDLRK